MNEEQQKAFQDSLLKGLAPAIEKIVETQVEAKTGDIKSFNETVTELKKEIADLNLLSKKVNGVEKQEARQKAGKFFREYVKAFQTNDFTQVKVLSEGTPSEGGYLVPSEFHGEVIRVAALTGFARKYCTIIPMGGDQKDVTTLSTGATAYVVGEKGSITASDPVFGQKILNARKFAALVTQTQELIDDNMTDEDVLVLVAKLCAEALSYLEDAQVLTGSGSGLNMQGVLTDSGAVVVTLPSTKTAFSDITYAKLIEMKNAVRQKYKQSPNAKVAWVMNEDVFTYIEQLVDTTGRPLVRESLTAPDTYTLLGYPIEFSDSMPGTSASAANTKFLIFGAWKFFILGDRKSITTEQGYLTDDFVKDQRTLKVVERVAGVNAIPAAFSVLKTAAS